MCIEVDNPGNGYPGTHLSKSRKKSPDPAPHFRVKTVDYSVNPIKSRVLLLEFFAAATAIEKSIFLRKRAYIPTRRVQLIMGLRL